MLKQISQLTPGMRITTSTNVQRGSWILPNSDTQLKTAAVVISGNDIVVDFGGATVRGTAASTEPDMRAGTGIIIQGKNITVRNLRIHGYKVAIAALGADGLVLENVDASHNWKQHLLSTDEKEDLGDWMSYHQNEKDEWLRYGAAFYLRDTDDFAITKCTARGGQNGLMMTRCDRGNIHHNDFSFLSSLGIGMYRASWNRILHNKIDWCVRGYSHGVYNRGQDSAGILIYEQSSNNVFAYNSVTHGGDGFFLWAGQNTMDTGRGGCDDNLLYGNDFSHAPTNGIEATFSRNQFVHNLIAECWHGIWGGYSYDTTIVGNTFGYNAEAIAIEHGRDNLISDNGFFRDRVGVKLWANPSQDPNWAYVRKHATSSERYTIEGNTFVDVKTKSDVRLTEGVKDRANRVVNTTPTPAETMQGSGNTIVSSETNLAEYLERWDLAWHAGRPSRLASRYHVDPLDKPEWAMLAKNALRGRRFIIVDEWGPYDFQSPRLVHRGDGHYDILGPKGKWRVVDAQGATLSATSGTVPGAVTIQTPAGQAGTTKVVLEYRGGATTDYKGVQTAAGEPVRFGFSRFFAPISWEVRFHSWSKSVDKSDIHAAPDPEHFHQQLATTPLLTMKTDKLDFAGYAFAKGLPNHHVITVADGKFTIPAGEYVLDITTDDGCRIWLDGKELPLGAWKYQGPTAYPAKVRLGGNHTLRVEHFQIDGYAALKVALRPASN